MIEYTEIRECGGMRGTVENVQPKKSNIILQPKKLLRPCITAFLTIMTAASFLSCGLPNEKSTETPVSVPVVEPPERVDTGLILTGPDSYDSADTAILVGKNKENNTVTLLNLWVGRRYTLSLDGTTNLYDKYRESISLEQIQVGDIVDVTFLKGSKHLTTMQLSSSAWKNEGVDRYEIDMIRGEVTIGADVYKLTENTQYLSGGHSIGEMDLNAADVLDFQGIDSQVLSISVEKGHGYLRLTNDENFIGGWIEVGQSNIQKITEDMLLVVPEGSYRVTISHRGGGGIKSVVINRNEETTLDIGDLEIPEPQTGMVLFSLNPPKADLYIDGEKADASQPVVLEYGIHQLIVKAEGYKSITQYIRVGQASAGLDIVLDRVQSEDDEDKDQSGDVTDIASDSYKVHIDAPDDAEVYLDGNYIGISPCSFRKQEGAHVITLRRAGYTTRSYTIQVDGEDKDISYSFADLVKTDSSNDSTAAGSGNTTDDSNSKEQTSGSEGSGTNGQTSGSEGSGTNGQTSGSEGSGTNGQTSGSDSSDSKEQTSESENSDSKEQTTGSSEKNSTATNVEGTN